MAVVASDTVAEKAGYVSWGAAIAGALLASALSFVLLTFGSAVGLSLVSPWTSTAPSSIRPSSPNSRPRCGPLVKVSSWDAEWINMVFNRWNFTTAGRFERIA